MFIRLTESRKNRDTGAMHYFKILVNINAITYIQPPISGGNTYIGICGDKFMFVKETLEEVEALINKKPQLHVDGRRMQLLDKSG